MDCCRLPEITAMTDTRRSGSPVRMHSLAALFVLIAFSPGCGTEKIPESAESGIVTTFGALHGIIQPVVGERPVSVLLPPGISPHAYAPRPSQIATLNRASLVVYAHSDIDGWMADLSSRPSLALFESGSLDSKRSTDQRDESGQSTHDHGGQDPHMWSDPVLVMEALPAVTDRLCAVYAEGCSSMRRQATIFSGRLSILVDSLAQAASEWQSNNEEACFITAQPFMDRFLDRFGFRFIGPLSVSPDVEPSPASLSRLVSRASEQGCTTLIVQEALENRLEKRLAAEQRWDVVVVDPVGSPTSSYPAYLERMMQSLTNLPRATEQTPPSP